MTKTKPPVEDRIKKNYQAEDGIWLVQAGKITEAKLLKEAYERILYLKRIANHNKDLYENAVEKKVQTYRDEYNVHRKKIKELEQEIRNQKDINKKLAYSYRGIKHAVAEIELLSNNIEENS